MEHVAIFARDITGRRRAEELFSMERIVPLYERHYERVLGR